jgi:hypothetical protein
MRDDKERFNRVREMERKEKNSVGCFQRGPWIVEEHSKSEYYQVQTKPGIYPRSLVATCGYKGDAYLCAAAPELLEALKAMVNTWDAYMTSPKGYPAYQKAKDIIAKAEGSTVSPR